MKTLSTLRAIAARIKTENLKRQEVKKGAEKLPELPIKSIRRLGT
jgi:hypothetical protein